LGGLPHKEFDALERKRQLVGVKSFRDNGDDFLPHAQSCSKLKIEVGTVYASWINQENDGVTFPKPLFQRFTQQLAGLNIELIEPHVETVVNQISGELARPLMLGVRLSD